MKYTEVDIVRPSSADRWLICSGSVRLILRHVNAGNIDIEQSSMYAKAGVDAHETAYDLLAHMIDNPELPPKPCYDAAVGEYTDYVMNLFDRVKCLIKLEYEIDLSDLLPQMKGTADSIIYDAESKELHVLDFKYGAGVRVSSYENKQLMLYGYGILRKLKAKGVVPESVHLHIIQPRVAEGIHSYETTPEFINRFIDEGVKPIIKGGFPEDYNPNEKACRFCPTKQVCPAYMDQLQVIANHQLEYDSKDKAITEFVLEHGDNLIKFIKFIQESSLKRVLGGEKIEGFKLVRGRGRRVWNEQAEGVVSGLLGDDAWKRTLIPITKASEHLDGELIQELTTKTEGSYKLVPRSSNGKECIIHEIMPEMLEE